jgi:hypothetical protein
VTSIAKQRPPKVRGAQDVIAATQRILQQFSTVKRFLSNQIVAMENTTVRKRCSLSSPEDLLKGVDLDSEESVSQSVSCQHSEGEEIQGPLQDKPPEGQNSL